MKKTYISPETIVVTLLPVTTLLEGSPKGIYNEQGDGIYTKENAGGDEGSSTSSTNVWDEEW